MPEHPDDLEGVGDDDLIDAADAAWVAALLRPGTSEARMPDATWLRLERALMAEAATRESGAPTADDLAGSSSAPRASKRRGTAWLALAASAALVIGGTAIATQALRDGGTGPAPDTLVAAGDAGMPSERIVASGTDYRPATLGQQAKATFQSIRQAIAPRQAASGAADASPVSSPVAAAAAPAAPLMEELPFLSDPAAFGDCLGRMAEGSEPIDVLLVDIARWEGGVTAAVVLLPASAVSPTDASSMEHVFVVDAGCAVRLHVRFDIDQP